MSSEKTVKGVRAIFYDQADENGEFYVPGLAVRWVGLDAYYLDPESGEITYAADRGQAARIYKPEFGMDWWITRATRIMFPCVSTDFYETVDPRYLTKLPSLSLYGDGNTAPREYGYTLGYGPNEPVGVVFTPPGVKLKITMQTKGIGIRYMLLNATDTTSVEAARKSGFVAATHGAITHTAYQAAKDMWVLDHARMRELNDYGIENDRLSDLHNRAAAHLARADSARQQLRWDEFIRHSRAALGLESRAYPDVKGTQNDVIRGIIFFMALVLPCAFFGERLIFTAVDIRWQIVGFAGIFVVIWVFLSIVHPAFDLSNPFVILLAFVLLALASFVISLVFSRFNSQMRNLRTEAAVIHDVDVGRISASLAAFQLGIANMKRRKLRTALTFTTLVLLTFTVLSFSSIKSQLKFHQISRDNLGPYPGMLIRSKYWAPLEESVLDYVNANFGQEAVVAARSWYASKEKKAIQVASDSASANALGIVGLTAQETDVIGIQDCLAAGRWFLPGERNVAVLPQAMADLLKIGEADIGQAEVRLFGERFKVVGLIDAERMKDLEDLDGEPLTPADFVLTDENVFMQMAQQEKREKAGLEETDVEIMEFEHLDPANVMVVPYQALREVNSPLQAIAVRFRDPSVVTAAGGKLYLAALRRPLCGGPGNLSRGRNRTHCGFRVLLFRTGVGAGPEQPVYSHRHRRPDRIEHDDGVGLRTIPGNRHLFLGRPCARAHRLPVPGRVLRLRGAWRGFGLSARAGRFQNRALAGASGGHHRELFLHLRHGLLHARDARGDPLHHLPRPPGFAAGGSGYHAALETSGSGSGPLGF